MQKTYIQTFDNNNTSMSKIKLVPVREEDRNQFILDCQESFRYGSLEEFGERNTHLDKDGEVMSRSSIEAVLNSSKAESYIITQEGESVGGLVIDIDSENKKGELSLLFTNANIHSKGIGYATWCEVERMHPEIKIWETLTPYFETRNIHFYVNRCGFHIVEFFNERHPYEGPDSEDANELGGAFLFRKVIE
mgnify:CR=1 FL=1